MQVLWVISEPLNELTDINVTKLCVLQPVFEQSIEIVQQNRVT